VATLKVAIACESPEVTEFAINVKVIAVAAASFAVSVVQTTVSAPAIPSTVTVEVPTVSTHLAVAATPVPVSVLALVGSTALKYLFGKAIVILPPIGTSVTVVKPRVTAAVFRVPGTWFPAVANAMAIPVVS